MPKNPETTFTISSYSLFLVIIMKITPWIFSKDGISVVRSRDESGSTVNWSLGQAIQNLSVDQLAPGFNINFNCIN